MRIEKYRFKLFEKYKNVRYGVSSKTFGSMKKDAEQMDRDKLTTFANSIGISENVVCMRQIHSSTIRVVEDASDLRIADTDGLITNKKNLPLAMLTADCLPVLFYDQRKNVIGVTHAGYKGLVNHVLENTVERFISEFSSDPKDIIVGIGPSIEKACYEVSKERVEEFESAFPDFTNMYEALDGKFYLDLRSIARQCLLKEGILEGNIESMNICTKCNLDFYSYRRRDKYERFVSVISLV